MYSTYDTHISTLNIQYGVSKFQSLKKLSLKSLFVKLNLISTYKSKNRFQELLFICSPLLSTRKALLKFPILNP